MIILASASPRRQHMFEQAGLDFQIQPAHIDETPFPDERPYDHVLRLAKEKAAAITKQTPEKTVVAADTIVTFDNHILGKPVDMADAERMIRMLSGRSHQVMTGVCISRGRPAYEKAWVAITTVTFKSLSGAEIANYLSVAQPLDKAGGYAIQEHRDILIQSIDGLYSNVVGLPIEEVLAALKEIQAD